MIINNIDTFAKKVNSIYNDNVKLYIIDDKKQEKEVNKMITKEQKETKNKYINTMFDICNNEGDTETTTDIIGLAMFYKICQPDHTENEFYQGLSDYEKDGYFYIDAGCYAVISKIKEV